MNRAYTFKWAVEKQRNLTLNTRSNINTDSIL